MARVIAVCNQKGGVGKTTTAVNMSAYLALAGKRVLLVDFDPQGNASSTLGSNPATIEKSVYHGLAGVPAPDIIQKSSLDLFHYMPASNDLAGAMIELVDESNRESRLRQLLMHVRHEYNYIVIDLPPSLGLLTVNGLVAADEVIVPVQCEYYSLEGLTQLLSTVNLISKNLRHPLKISGALLTMYNRRERLSRDVAKDMRRYFPYRVFETEIPRNVALAEAPSFSKTIYHYAPYSRGARAYERFAREVVGQETPALVPEPANSI